MLTLQEEFGDLSGLKLAYIGDGNNVTHSLIIISSILGLEFTAITPPGHEIDNYYLDLGMKLAQQYNHPMPVTCNDPLVARSCDVIYADVWASMGSNEYENTSNSTKNIFSPYQVNHELLNNKNIKIMHCLPAHKGEEITSELFEENQEIIFRQAENRLHAQKAILLDMFK